MKIVRFSADHKTRYGMLEGHSIQVIEDNPFRKITPVDQYYSLGDVQLLSPCTPSKIVAVGLNYHSHATELNSPIPDAPLLFLKPSTAVIGPEDNISYPPASSRVDYEGELAVVIKKAAWCISAENTMGYILGYTCFNDVTARDLQSSNGQWTRAKGFDTFAALGPCIETDLDPANVDIETYLNGELKQQGSTSDLIYTIPQLIDFASHVMSLLPGDIIATGTPSGIGPMYPGDTIEIRIESVGILRNYVV